MYEDFVIKNAGSVGQIEGALRSLSYIIPGKTPITSITTYTDERSGQTC